MTVKLTISPYPLEKEVTTRIAQAELEKLSYDELLDFSKRVLSLMGQLTFYTEELIVSLKELDIEVEPEEPV